MVFDAKPDQDRFPAFFGSGLYMFSPFLQKTLIRKDGNLR